jgi:hypothetical protein
VSARGLFVALAMLAGVTLLGGCDDSVRFRLRFEWQRHPLAQACPTNSSNEYTCEAIPVSCDLRVRVRIISASTGQPYYSECFTIQSDGDACLLGDMPLAPRAIPNEMVRVQVIVWTEEEVARVGAALPDGCPVTTEFNIGGLPRLGEDPTGNPAGLPVPALGGETYFAVGESPVATVTLGCPRWDTLDAASCQANAINLEATVRDPRTFGSVSRMDAGDMEVRFGEPQPDGTGAWRVDTAPQFFTGALGFSPSGSLIWTGTLPERPMGTRCLRVAMQGVAAPTITCFPISSGQSPIRVDGHLVGRLMLRDLLDIQLLSDVPEEGMVFGVVVDAAGQPVAGATVSTTGSASVVYPDDNLQTVGFTSTGNRGYFLSSDAPYESIWRANVPGGLMGDGDARGGLINDHVSVVIIQLTGVVTPPIDSGLGGGVPDDAGVDAP